MNQKNSKAIKLNIENEVPDILLNENKDFSKVNSSSKLYEILNAQKIELFDYKKPFSKLSFQYWYNNFRLKNQKSKIYLIIMQLRNGKYTFFIVTTLMNYFEYKKSMYQINTDFIREDTHTNLPVLYYHQDISTPFKIEINLDKIHDTIVKDEDITIDKALNPSSLKAFINSQVIEKVLKGQELSDEMRFIKILIIINLLVSIITLFIFAKGSGMI